MDQVNQPSQQSQPPAMAMPTMSTDFFPLREKLDDCGQAILSKLDPEDRLSWREEILTCKLAAFYAIANKAAQMIQCTVVELADLKSHGDPSSTKAWPPVDCHSHCKRLRTAEGLLRMFSVDLRVHIELEKEEFEEYFDSLT